jgi:hypothetical protein
MALGAAIVAAAPVAAAPTLAVTPHTGLTDGQAVSLAASGFSFTSDTPVGAAECTRGSVAISSCDLADTFTSTTASTGTFTFSYNVTRHIVTPDSGAVDCAVPKSCEIAVRPIDLSAVAIAPIEFTAPRVNLRVLNARLVHRVLPGEPVEVRATVVNGGPLPTSFVVTDSPGTGLTDVAVTCAGNGQTPGPGSCAYSPADAPVHQRVATVFTLQVAAGVVGPVIDQVCVHDQNANDVDIRPRNNCRQVTIRLPAAP